MTWGAVVTAGVGLVGASMSAGAAEDAAAGQQQASQQSNMLQQYMYDNNNALMAPQLNAGNAARDRLSYLLGLSATGFTGSSSPGSSGISQLGTSTNPNAPLNYDQIRAQLLPQFTTFQQSNAAAAFDPSVLNPIDRWRYETAGSPELQAQFAANYGTQGQGGGAGVGPGYWGNEVGTTGQRQWVSTDPASGGANQIDEAALDAAIRQRLQEQQDAAAAREAAARQNPEFGSLAQGFQFNTYTPDTFSYTGQDLYADPSYQFRLQQGQKALDRQGLAAGRFLSGGQLQAASDYNQGAASQEFQAAYGRAANTFNTNEGNRFGAFNQNEGNRYNAFQTNFTNTVNPLLALSGAGQLASANLMQNNNNYASNVGANLTGAANAAGAAGIAGSNAYSGALTGGVNAYQQQNTLNSLLNRNTGTNNNPAAIAAANNSADPIYSLGNSGNWWGG